MGKYEIITIDDIDNASEDKLLEVITANNACYRKMSIKVDDLLRLKKRGASTKTFVATATSATKQGENTSSTVDDFDPDFEETVEYYYSMIKDLPVEQLEQNLEALLPPRSDYQYERTLRRLQAELLRECKDVRTFIATEPDLSPSDKEELYTEIHCYMAKFEKIAEEISAKEKEIKSVTENNLIFVPTTDGKIRIFDDIAEMNPEQTQAIAKLLTSIKDGTFKNERYLNEFSLSEVREFTMNGHVTFMRLNDDTYAVIGACAKNPSNNAYRNILSEHSQAYSEVESKLKENATNPKFLALHKSYEQELFNKLNPQTTKPAVYTKKGDN